MRKFNFSNRIILIWYSLPYHGVASPTMFDTIEKADISFTGSRSKVELTID